METLKLAAREGIVYHQLTVVRQIHAVGYELGYGPVNANKHTNYILQWLTVAVIILYSELFDCSLGHC